MKSRGSAKTQPPGTTDSAAAPPEARPDLETVADSRGVPIALIIRSAFEPAATRFVTDPDASLQAGFVVYPRGGEVPRHVHRPIDRRIRNTLEVLLVRRGRCEVDLYDGARALVCTRELREGDLLVLLSGGHGFRMLEDTVLVEVKQGPYVGLDEKERF